MNFIKLAQNEVIRLIKEGYDKAAKGGKLPYYEDLTVPVESPRDRSNGDYSSTFALACAKKLKMPPKKIADETVLNISLDGSFFDQVTVAGAGFLNFNLGQAFYNKVLKNIADEGPLYGKTKDLKPEKIMVEFVSANPTGPMHMGNARGGIIGDCLSEVLLRAGNEVYKEFLINDAGNQIDLFGKSLEVRYINLIKGEETVPFPQDGYHGEDIKELAEKFIQKFGTDYIDCGETERRKALISFGLNNNLKLMKEVLNRYGIEYDRWFSESELHESGYIKDTMELLKARGATYEQDGAIWLKSTDFGCEKDDVLVRQNGFYTYFAADIAYHRDKLSKRGFDKAINIWGADHHGHVKRLKGALDALGLDGTNRLEIILMQLVNLTRDGEVVRMSKRTGKMISLSDLLDEISVDAARFFFNSRAADSHLDFDLSLAVRKDSENPVYYVQYAHARIMSILRNLSEIGIVASKDANLDLLASASERELIKELSRFPEEIFTAATLRQPEKINKYAVVIAAAFHKFYTENNIKDAAIDLRDARILLLNATRTVIENTLSIIGVSAPDKM